MGLERTMTPEQITAFVAVIQLGTLVAVIVYFIRDIMSITLAFCRGICSGCRIRDASPRSRAAGMVDHHRLIPIGTIGLLAKKIIEGNLTKNLMVIGVSMISWPSCVFGGTVRQTRNEIEHIGIREALTAVVARQVDAARRT